MWPEFKGRDGCRTPMPWSADAPHAGFTTADKPWLPVADTHTALAVDRQLDQPDSLLTHFTQLLHWRREQPALQHGSLALLPPHEQVLGFVREHGNQRLLCLFNFSERPATLVLPNDWAAEGILPGSGLSGARIDNGSVCFEPWGGLFLQAR